LDTRSTSNEHDASVKKSTPLRNTSASSFSLP
jgi:hypothetical protein